MSAGFENNAAACEEGAKVGRFTVRGGGPHQPKYVQRYTSVKSPVEDTSASVPWKRGCGRGERWGRGDSASCQAVSRGAASATLREKDGSTREIRGDSAGRRLICDSMREEAAATSFSVPWENHLKASSAPAPPLEADDEPRRFSGPICAARANISVREW